MTMTPFPSTLLFWMAYAMYAEPRFIAWVLKARGILLSRKHFVVDNVNAAHAGGDEMKHHPRLAPLLTTTLLNVHSEASSSFVV